MQRKNIFGTFIALLILLGFAASLTAQRYTFQKIGLEQGIPSSRVNDFLEDSRGFFWIATEGAGLVRYDGFSFKTIDLGKEGIKPIVTALAEDKDGHLWLAAENALIEFNGRDFNFHYLPARQERILSIDFTAGGEVLAAIPSGVYQSNGGDTLKLVSDQQQGRIRDIAWFEDQMWVASSAGLYRGEEMVEPGGWTNFRNFKNQLHVQGDSAFWESELGLVDHDLHGDHFCLGGNQKVALRRDSLVLQKDGQYRYFTSENGLPDEDFKGCFIDRSGVLWLYSNNGLTKLPGTAFRLYETAGGEVRSVLKDGERYLAGTRDLSVVEGTGISKALREQFSYGVILSMAKFRGDYWLGTESGLVRYDGNNFRLVPLGSGLGDFVFALKATDEALWIGSGSGIFRFRNGRIGNVSQEEELPLASVYAISEGNDGSLWFATYTQGFFRRHNGQWENMRELGGMRLDSLRFNTFTAVSQNELWLGTLSEGLFHIGENSNDVLPPAKLNFAEIRSMVTDPEGGLWLGTNKGVFKLERLEEGFRVELLNQSQQLLEDGCAPQAIDLEDGILLAGSENGLLVIDIAELEKKRAPPAIALTEVELFYGDVEGLPDYAAGRAEFTQVPVELKLPHDLNFLSFTLAGLSGYGPGDLVYRYRINPSENWTQAGTRREAVYPNLPPGSYEFQAQVKRPGEEWSEAMLSYPFRIKPPLWQQWWFITAVILLLGLISYWYVRQRIARVNQRLRLENNLLDMERKALRLQMNPHFIFNALDSISSFIFKKDPEQAVRYLNNFAKLMRLTLESSMEHLHPVETEVSILKNYLELEKLRFQGSLDYEIELDEEIDYDVGIPPMLIQPHVENAILHGIKPKEGGGKVIIRFKLEGELLICEVEDDGIGRLKSKELPKRKDHRSMATEINKGRLALLRKSLGDKVDIRIIDKENPTGTKVVIKLPAEHF